MMIQTRLHLPVLDRMFAALIGAFALVAMVVSTVHARVEIDVTRGNVEPLPIAIAPFVGDGGIGGEI
ncbi:MAG: hypothetical protein AAGF29_08435, partial [Pseudomonadota bacterium]